MADEERVTSSTGGQKGAKLAQLGAIDPEALLLVAEVAGFGGKKYERYNYRKGFDWSLSFDAAMRHALKFWAGEDNDPESGLPHAAHAAWHFLAMLHFMREHPEFDDRPSAVKGTPPDWWEELMGAIRGPVVIPTMPAVDTESSTDLLNKYHAKVAQEWSLPEPDYRP